jgi:ribosome recycling factor
VRQARREGNDRLKKMLKDKLISEDSERGALDEIQKHTDSFITRIDELTKSKEQEIMSV